MSSKTCERGKVYNPKTGRCVYKSGKIGQEILKNMKNKSPCSEDKVYNPKTGRCVYKSGKTGQEILSNKKKSKSPKKKSKSPKKKSKSPKKKSKSPKKKCKSNQYLNSKTNRCRNIKRPSNEKHSSGKKLSRTALRSTPTLKTKNLLENCTQVKQWAKKRQLGKGAVGQVYRACKSGNCTFIVKVQKSDAEFKNEVRLLQYLQGWKHVPKLYDAWMCKGKGYIVQEELSDLKMPKKTAYIQLKQIFKQLHSKNVVQPDCHDGNIMQRSDGTIVLIDFGWGAYFPTKTTKIYDGKLSQDLGRKVSMKEMIAWESCILADDFGNKKEIREANNMYSKIIHS